MDNADEFERMWSQLSPQTRTDMMADPGKRLTRDEVIKVTGSGKLPVVISDAYWVATQSGPDGFHLTSDFRAFIERKATAEPS